MSRKIRSPCGNNDAGITMSIINIGDIKGDLCDFGCQLEINHIGPHTYIIGAGSYYYRFNWYSENPRIMRDVKHI